MHDSLAVDFYKLFECHNSKNFFFTFENVHILTHNIYIHALSPRDACAYLIQHICIYL